MQPMVANDSKERKIFAAALNARVAKDHPSKRGRPRWLFEMIEDYRRRHPREGFESVSVQTCAYWLKGEKIAKERNATLLIAVLGISRGELYGEATDPRLARVIAEWDTAPERLKQAIMMDSVIDRDEEAS